MIFSHQWSCFKCWLFCFRIHKEEIEKDIHSKNNLCGARWKGILKEDEHEFWDEEHLGLCEHDGQDQREAESADDSGNAHTRKGI